MSSPARKSRHKRSSSFEIKHSEMGHFFSWVRNPFRKKEDQFIEEVEDDHDELDAPCVIPCPPPPLKTCVSVVLSVVPLLVSFRFLHPKGLYLALCFLLFGLWMSTSSLSQKRSP